MFGYSIIKTKEKEKFGTYKKVAKKYATFKKSCWGGRFIVDYNIEDIIKEYDKLQFKYDVLLSLAKYYNPGIEQDVNKQVIDLKRVKCKEV